MNSFPDVITAISEGALAGGLGVTKTLVAVWKHRKRIPSKYWQDIAALDMAKKKRVTVAVLAGLDARLAETRRKRAA